MLLAGRMGYLSIFENEHYQLLSESNRVNLTLTPPRRGWIVDRNNAPIATNRTSYRVDLIPDRIENKDAVVAELTRILSLTPEDVDRIQTDLKRSSGFTPVAVV